MIEMCAWVYIVGFARVGYPQKFDGEILATFPKRSIS